MKNLTVTLFFLILLVFSSCKLPDMVLQDSFKSSATEYLVKGRTGWTKKKPMSFGPYLATSVKRGWTSTYNIPFVVKFQGSKHKISFDMSKGTTYQASTYALGKIKSRELPILGGLMRIPLKYESYFAGAIQLSKDEIYHFAIPLPFENTFDGEEVGVLELENETFEIFKIRQLEGQMKFKYNELSGFEIRKDGVPVAAVQKINKDKIWISQTVTEKEQFLLANLCGAILLMKNLEDEILNIENN